MGATAANWRERPKELWIAVLGIGIALSPTNTKIAGAAWLLLCMAGLVAFFRAPAATDDRASASKAWLIACALAAALAVIVALIWPDRPDTLHAEFRLLVAAVATHQLVRHIPGAERWRTLMLPVLALACGAAFGVIASGHDRHSVPSNPIPWAVAIAFLVCILIPDLLASPVRDACRRWCVGSLALGFAAIFLSQSRAAFWVFVWAFWLVAAYWSQTLARINLRAVATVGLAGLVLAASTAWLPRDPLRLREGWTEVAGAMRDGNYNTSMGARLYNWSLGWESFKESPWVGIGGRERLKRIKSAGMDLPPDQRARFQEVRNVGHVHNQYLHAAMDGGLIGLASTLAVLAGLGASAWRLRRLDPVASRQMQGVLFMHATAGLTNVNMAHNYYAIMLSLTVAVILIGAGARAGGPEPVPAA
jgi:O-antigen ligase